MLQIPKLPFWIYMFLILIVWAQQKKNDKLDEFDFEIGNFPFLCVPLMDFVLFD